ncbi:MAG TPA: ABC transporter ATP-binding protein [Clostridia bacterium]|nr:ABC transporter ATP-binding protein [Clostridia bacterium]HPK16486.1 ABC transporter ATP-binding protein [Clostridia bacterium]
MALLSIENLNVTYTTNGERVYAVDGVSLDVLQGRSLGIVGESGSGKSTLMHAVLRILHEKIAKVEGKIVFDGRDLLALDDREMMKLRWTELAVVFQKSMNALSPVHRVGSFMRDVYHVHRPEASREEGRARVLALLEMVNLPAKRVYRLYPHELSGGMMQRVGIAMSLMFNPKLLIMDEATTALDVVTQTQIIQEIQALEKQLNVTRIMVTHDMSVVATACDEVAVIYAGRLVEMGSTLDTLVDPLHPYTRCLIQSYPNFSDEGDACRSIPGTLPDMRERPEGCIFAARCPEAKEICLLQKPLMRDYGARRRAACHFAEVKSHD